MPFSDAITLCGDKDGVIAWPRSEMENEMLADVGKTWLEPIDHLSFWNGKSKTEMAENNHYLLKAGNWENGTGEKFAVTCYLQRYKIATENGILNKSGKIINFSTAKFADLVLRG